MYTGYFGFSESPFSIAPNPHFLFMSARHREALAHLTYGLGETGGFVLLTGEVGTGKTTVSRCLLEQIPENTQAAFILNPTLSAQELLATICDELKIRYRKTGATLKTLTDKIQAKLLKNHEAGVHTLLIIDEAQHLQAEVLEQLRLLTNLETNTKKLLQVILIGQPELQQLLQRRDLRQLAQRITARYHLLPLNRQEVAQYVSHRLSVVGCEQALFTDSAINCIHKLSHGIPRLINLLCDRALLGAYGENKQKVDKKLILGACQEALGIEYQPEHWWTKPWLKYISVIVLFISLLVAGFWYGNSANQKSELVANANESQTVKDNSVVAPSEQVQQIHLPQAVKELLNLWRIHLPQTIKEPCQTIEPYHLACYWHKGNIKSLADLNYPAVLKFFNDEGQAFYGVFKGLEQQKLILSFAGQSYTVDSVWLNQYWHGAALIFWQAPRTIDNQFVDQISKGSSIALIQWLEGKLSEQQNRPSRKLTSFDALLINQLQQFQRQNSLVVTDYADIMTLLALTNTVKQGLPIFTQG